MFEADKGLDGRWIVRNRDAEMIFDLIDPTEEKAKQLADWLNENVKKMEHDSETLTPGGGIG